MKLRKIFATACVAVAALGIASCSQKQQTESATEQSEQAVEATTPTEAPAVIVLQKGESLKPADGKLVVIDFNATWCGPCKQFAPHFDAVAEANAGKATFYSIDVDVHPELAGEFGVESIPMVVYIKPDGTIDSTVGYMDESQFAEAVAAHL